MGTVSGRGPQSDQAAPRSQVSSTILATDWGGVWQGPWDSHSNTPRLQHQRERWRACGTGKRLLHHSLAKEKSQSSLNRPTNSSQQRARMYFVPSTLLVTQSQPSHGSRHPKILQQSQGVSSGLVPQTRLFLGFPRPSKRMRANIELKSKMNMEWLSMHSVFMSQWPVVWTSGLCL